MSRVIDIKKFQFIKARRNEEKDYLKSLLAMNKASLLQELLKYREDFHKRPYDVQISIRGQILLEVLEERVELPELIELVHELQHKVSQRLQIQLDHAEKRTQL